MNAEYVNAFLVPAVEVLRKLARVRVRRGRVRRVEDVHVGGNLSVLIGLQGGLSGAVVLTASREVARALAVRVAGPDTESDRDVHAVWTEVANMIVGNATGFLERLGLRETLTPPAVLDGNGVYLEFGEGVENVVLPLETDLGRVDMIVSLVRETP